MSKEKLKSTLTDIKSVEAEIYQLAKAEAFLSEQEADYNREALALENKYKNATKSWIEKKNAAIQNLELWAGENKKQFKVTAQGGSVLKNTYGQLSFRKSTGKIEMLKKIKNGMKQAAIDLKDMFQNKYVRTVFEVNKEALIEDYRANLISSIELSTVNLRYRDDPEFTVKINWKKLEKEGLKLVEVKKAV